MKLAPETQLVLFQPPARARRTDPDSSFEGAAVVDVVGLQEKVFNTLKARGPLTSRQVADILGRDLVSVSPRFRPLEEMALIRRTGVKLGRSELWEVVER